MKNKLIMFIMTLLIIIFIMILIITLVRSEGLKKELYSVEGFIDSIECDRSSKNITLSNGVKYKLPSGINQPYCEINEEVEVILYHDKYLIVDLIEMKTSKKVK